MRLTVYGLWHLGCVTAASLAQESDFEVYGLDSEAAVVQALQAGQPPLFEPGLAELIQAGLAAGRLRFTDDYATALAQAEVLWVAFDTPVDEADRADVAFVEQQLDKAFPFIQSGTLIIISSQVPVGFSHRLKQRWQQRDPAKALTYCYSPENLRLGHALKSFRADDRIVVGLDDEAGRDRVSQVLGRFSPRLEFMRIESAEMVKHALNSFLAVSVAMINEIARLCEISGADAKEVERGLKSEGRIGPKAYLGPGAPFAGGTLARDLRFLTGLGQQAGLETPLLSGALASNELHKGWVQQTAAQVLDGLTAARVAILGLTYKAGTDTLRRSEAVNLGLWLAEQGCEVIFHDPVTPELPDYLAAHFGLTNDLDMALAQADLLVVATGWPVYREQISPARLSATMRRAAVIDQNRYLSAQLEGQPTIVYRAVGLPG